MARYLEQLNECTDPVSGDFLPIYDASAGATDKDRKANISRFAVLANANTFTTRQTFTPPVSTEAIYITPPTNHNANTVYLADYDNGSSFGTVIRVGRNSNATTPASGFVTLVNRAGTAYYHWVDSSGNLRINSAALPTNANDASGTVVGAQTSYVGIKEDVTPWDDAQSALDAVLACKLFQYHLKGDASKRQYAGLVITDEDRGAWFSENDAPGQTPALNERNLFGYLIAAIQAQQVQIDELRARCAELGDKC